MSKSAYIGGTRSLNFLASVSVSTLAGQASLLIKPIIAGNVLGGNAIAAMSLTTPILEICYALISLFVVGASYMTTECTSINDTRTASKHFSVSAISTLAVLSLLSLALLVSNDSLSVILGGKNPELTGMVKDYMHIIAWSFIPLGLFNIFIYNFQATGQLRRVVRCSITVSALDIVLSLLFAAVFRMGIASFAWSFLISSLLGTLILTIAAKRQSYFQFTDIRHDFFHYLKINIQKGYPLMVDDLLCIIMFLFCNIIIVNRIGGNGPVIWGVANYFITVAMILMTIISEATMTLGLEMCSTNDYHSCNRLVRWHRLIINVITVSILAFVELFPDVVMSFFGEPGMVDPSTCNNLRMAVSIMAVMSVVMYEATDYYLFDKAGTYIAFTAVFYLGPVILLFLFTSFCPSYSWWAFPISTAVSLVCAALISKDIHKRINDLYRDIASMEEPVAYKFSAIEPVLKSVGSFLNEQGIAPESVNATVHCIDELSYNIIKHAPKKLKGKTFDVRAVKVKDDIIIFCKYGGKPFNPIMKFEGSTWESMEKGNKQQLALRIFLFSAMGHPFQQFAEMMLSSSVTSGSSFV